MVKAGFFIWIVIFYGQFVPTLHQRNMTSLKWDNHPSPSSTCNRNTINMTHVIEGLLVGYDRHYLPSPEGVNVTMEVHVQDISNINEIGADFELDVMYSEIWVDPRLNFRNLSLCVKSVPFRYPFREMLWNPDTVIINSKRAEMHKSPSDNIFIIVSDDGTVWMNHRMKIAAPCRMDLKMFPFDKLQCSVIFESYSYSEAEVRFRWHSEPVTFLNEVNLPDFGMASFEAKQVNAKYPNGIWVQLHLNFNFKRHFGFYLLQAYFPTSLTVISSWVGFFLDVRSVSARITLAVSSLLALTFQFGTLLKHLPRVSYIKCLDVWMIFSVGFIFFTLVELVVVSELARLERRRELGVKVFQQWRNTLGRHRVGSSSATADPTAPSTTTVPRSRAASLWPPDKNSDVRKELLGHHSVATENKRDSGASGVQKLSDAENVNGLSPAKCQSYNVSPTGFQLSQLHPPPTDESFPLRIMRRVAGWCVQLTARATPRSNIFCPSTWFTKDSSGVVFILKKYKLTAISVDKASRFIFPTIFILFNLFYWFGYALPVNLTA